MQIRPGPGLGLILFVAATGTSRLLAAQGEPGRIPILKPGIHDEVLRTAEVSVRYAISIPKELPPDKPVPLILALHYGGNPNGAGQGVLANLVQPALADLGSIIVAPESLGGAWSTTENERAVNALLDAVQASYHIDPKRIVVTGFSMGGVGTWYFAGKYPQRFSAAIPVAGMPPQSAGGWWTPVLAVHSRDDEVMPIGPTEARIKELQQNGGKAELVVLTGISHYETYRFVDGLKRAVPWLKEIWK